jgi:hypothetical protein
MPDKQFQERITHWGQVLLKTEMPESLVPQVARILAQDEAFGLQARSPEQQSIMKQAAESVSLAGVQS